MLFENDSEIIGKFPEIEMNVKMLNSVLRLIADQIAKVTILRVVQFRLRFSLLRFAKCDTLCLAQLLLLLLLWFLLSLLLLFLLLRRHRFFVIERIPQIQESDK